MVMYKASANRPPQWTDQGAAPTLPPQNVGANGYQMARQGANTGCMKASVPNQPNGNRNGYQPPQQTPNAGNQGQMRQQYNGNPNGYPAPPQAPPMGNQNYAGQNQSQGNGNQGRNRAPQQQYQQPNSPQAPQSGRNGHPRQQYQGQDQASFAGNMQGSQQQDQRNGNFRNPQLNNQNQFPDPRNAENNRRPYGENGKAQQDENGERPISKKIWKVNTGKKVIDFNDMLIPAYLTDYAFIHGRGGKDFAPNSTIELVICDYTRGRGDNSVTVRYRLDVEEIPTLLKAAQDARLGYIDALSPNGEFVLAREKNNPYTKDEDGYVKVGKLTIRYCKWDQQGKPNGYPWFIYIENFEAPLKMRQNGSSTHQSENGRNRTSAFINLTREDFDFAMVAVNRFVVSWEYFHLNQSLPKAYQMLEHQKQKNAAHANKA